MSGLKKFTIDRVLLFIVFWCVYSFKMQLGGVGAAGFRPDDMLIGIAFLLLLIRGAFASTRLTMPWKLYALFIGIGIVSSFWNGFQGRVNILFSLLFDIRLIEYMLFYFIGYVLAEYGRTQAVRKILTFYFYLMVVIVPLQMLHIVPVATSFGYLRASGNTNGPYEFAAVASFLLCYLGYQRRSFLKGFSSGVLVVLSASRITSVGVIVSLYSYLFRLSRRNPLTGILVLTSLMFFSGVGILLIQNAQLFADSGFRLFERFGSAAQGSSSATFFELYPRAPVYANSVDYLEGTFDHTCDNGACDDAVSDVSATIRLYRWSALIKSTRASLDSTVIGLGPSFASTAVDGYYIRVFAETGVVGEILFIASMLSFWQKRTRNQWAFREFLIIMLVSGSFIDIFTSYKPMILLWLWHGLNEGKLAVQKAALAEQDTAKTTHEAILVDA